MSNIHIQDLQNDQDSNSYESFKAKLIEVEQFPSIYTFKFIIPNLDTTQAEIRQVFEHPSTKITTKDSKTGKYNSLTVETFVNNADEVVAYYKRIGSIEKVIML